MDPLIELDAITNYIQPFLPVETAIELLNLPEEPYSGMLVLRFLGEEPRMINSWSSEHIRQWQVIYFHDHIGNVVGVSSQLAKQLIHGITIPYMDADRNMWFTRVRAYSVGQPQETESGKRFTLSVLETKTGSVRTSQQYALMQEYIMNLGG
ncbi:hypothetical protein [Sporosarcina sp. A2]|uniref:hypothetical protein n=1 Tax=Sporosarcina sp. A2 TaxID=3393449 RepID=UPI003D7A3BD5